MVVFFINLSPLLFLKHWYELVVVSFFSEDVFLRIFLFTKNNILRTINNIKNNNKKPITGRDGPAGASPVNRGLQDMKTYPRIKHNKQDTTTRREQYAPTNQRTKTVGAYCYTPRRPLNDSVDKKSLSFLKNFLNKNKRSEFLLRKFYRESLSIVWL